jgi:hypothetical protein
MFGKIDDILQFLTARLSVEEDEMGQVFIGERLVGLVKSACASLERGAVLQGLVDEGLVCETGTIRALVLGGESGASYSKKFTES